jgi:hypothetical protein
MAAVFIRLVFYGFINRTCGGYELWLAWNEKIVGLCEFLLAQAIIGERYFNNLLLFGHNAVFWIKTLPAPL